jgi:hypothetical protein
LDPCTRVASFMDSDCVAIDFLWEIFFLGDWLRKETDGSEPWIRFRVRHPISNLNAQADFSANLTH